MKRQVISNDLSIKKITEEVNEKSKHKIDDKVIEYKVKTNAKEEKAIKCEQLLIELNKCPMNYTYKTNIQVKIKEKEQELIDIKLENRKERGVKNYAAAI